MSEPSEPHRRARWLDRLSAMILFVGVGGALLAALPWLLRAADVIERPAEPPWIPTTRPSERSRAAPPDQEDIRASDRPPRFTPPDDPPRLTELEQMYPEAMWPGHARHQETPPRAGADLGAMRPWRGQARVPLEVREHPVAQANVLHVVNAGDAVTVLREVGDWAMVLRNGPEGLFGGWVRRAEVTPAP